MSASKDGIEEFKGDSSLVRDESGSWINYVSVLFSWDPLWRRVSFTDS